MDIRNFSCNRKLVSSIHHAAHRRGKRWEMGGSKEDGDVAQSQSLRDVSSIRNREAMEWSRFVTSANEVHRTRTFFVFLRGKHVG